MTVPPERITPEEIAAFADGELTGERQALVEAAAVADLDIMRQIERHRSLKGILVSHYWPVADEAVPHRLTATLGKAHGSDGEVVDLANARHHRERKERGSLARWGWIAGPALAASLVLAVSWPDQEDSRKDYADKQLAILLDRTLVTEQAPSAEARVLLSFRNNVGEYCRAFSDLGSSGIACRDERGWRLEQRDDGEAGGKTDYRMAGSSSSSVLVIAQEMADGPALNADAEALAMQRGWIEQSN